VDTEGVTTIALASRVRADAKVDLGTVDDVRLASRQIRTADGEADYFICAVPAERAARLFGPQLIQADPRLRGVAELTTHRYRGIQFYLRQPTPIVRGHILYVDSPWEILSISQAQFWGPARCATTVRSRGRCGRSSSSIWAQTYSAMTSSSAGSSIPG
jgi:hypothetical protein